MPVGSSCALPIRHSITRLLCSCFAQPTPSYAWMVLADGIHKEPPGVNSEVAAWLPALIPPDEQASLLLNRQTIFDVGNPRRGPCGARRRVVVSATYGHVL